MLNAPLPLLMGREGSQENVVTFDILRPLGWQDLSGQNRLDLVTDQGPIALDIA